MFNDTTKANIAAAQAFILAYPEAIATASETVIAAKKALDAAMLIPVPSFVRFPYLTEKAAVEKAQAAASFLTGRLEDEKRYLREKGIA